MVVFFLADLDLDPEDDTLESSSAAAFFLAPLTPAFFLAGDLVVLTSPLAFFLGLAEEARARLRGEGDSSSTAEASFSDVIFSLSSLAAAPRFEDEGGMVENGTNEEYCCRNGSVCWGSCFSDRVRAGWIQRALVVEIGRAIQNPTRGRQKHQKGWRFFNELER